MTPEQQQRIAEIEARQPSRAEWQYGKDIEFLLSIVKGQEVELTQAYYEDCEICEQVIISENGDKVYTFIVCGRCWNKSQEQIRNIATSMRSLCIEKVKANRADIRQRAVSRDHVLELVIQLLETEE